MEPGKDKVAIEILKLSNFSLNHPSSHGESRNVVSACGAKSVEPNLKWPAFGRPLRFRGGLCIS